MIFERIAIRTADDKLQLFAVLQSVTRWQILWKGDILATV
jgi:hypothetical protein